MQRGRLLRGESDTIFSETNHQALAHSNVFEQGLWLTMVNVSIGYFMVKNKSRGVDADAE